MPDFGRNQEPSLEDIHRSDSFIDALAGGFAAEPADQADAALAALLGSWRDENRWPPDAGLISEPQAIAALGAGLAEKKSGREKRTPTVIASSGASINRSRRGLSVVGAAAAAMLALGGFGAVVSGAGPGDSLYGLRTMLFGAPKQVRDDQVALAARTEMQQVQQLIAQGDWQQAQQKLVAVSTQVASVADEQQKTQLLDQFNNLSAKVVEKNPDATAAPGIIYTVPPSATSLVPVVAPASSSSSTPSASESATSSQSGTPSTTPTSSVPSTSAATTSAATTSAPTTSAPTTSAPTTSATATSAPSTSVPSTSAAPSTSATQQSQSATTTTTATSAKPSTTGTSTAPASTSSAPSRTSTPTTTATTPAPAAAATTSAGATSAGTTAASTTATTTTTAAAAGGPKSRTGASAGSTTAPAPSQPATQSQQAPQSQQVVTPTTTTVLVPVPAG